MPIPGLWDFFGTGFFNDFSVILVDQPFAMTRKTIRRSSPRRWLGSTSLTTSMYFKHFMIVYCFSVLTHRGDVFDTLDYVYGTLANRNGNK